MAGWPAGAAMPWKWPGPARPNNDIVLEWDARLCLRSLASFTFGRLAALAYNEAQLDHPFVSEERMSDSPPDDLPEAPDPAELPAAAQWMMAQAAAANTPAERAESELRFTSLPEREARIVGGLRANHKLTAGLEPGAAAALTEWGAAMGRFVVAETAGLDDATAEGILQVRVRAARQLMVHVARAITDPPPPGVAPLDTALRQADIVYGRRYRAPDGNAVGRALAHWSAAAGQPARQIAGLRSFVEEHIRPQTGAAGDDASRV